MVKVISEQGANVILVPAVEGVRNSPAPFDDEREATGKALSAFQKAADLVAAGGRADLSFTAAGSLWLRLPSWWEAAASSPSQEGPSREARFCWIEATLFDLARPYIPAATKLDPIGTAKTLGIMLDAISWRNHYSFPHHGPWEGGYFEGTGGLRRIAMQEAYHRAARDCARLFEKGHNEAVLNEHLGSLFRPMNADEEGGLYFPRILSTASVIMAHGGISSEHRRHMISVRSRMIKRLAKKEGFGLGSAG